jgi:hypothetical protein
VHPAAEIGTTIQEGNLDRVTVLQEDSSCFIGSLATMPISDRLMCRCVNFVSSVVGRCASLEIEATAGLDNWLF